MGKGNALFIHIRRTFVGIQLKLCKHQFERTFVWLYCRKSKQKLAAVVNESIIIQGHLVACWHIYKDNIKTKSYQENNMSLN